MGKLFSSHRMVRPLAVFMAVFIFSAFSLHGQNLTVRLNDVTVEHALEILKNRHGYSFVFKTDDMNLNAKVKADFKSAPIRKILDKIFEGQAVTYELDDKMVHVTKAVPAVSSKMPVGEGNRLSVKGKVLDQKREKRKEVADLLLDYRAMPYFSTWLSGTMKTECFSSPYTWNDFRTWEYLKDARFNRIAFPFHGLSDEELESMLEKIRSEGLMEKAYFYIWDEPTKMAEYAQIHSMADRLHQYAPEAKVITSFYRGPEDGDNVDDLFAVFDILDGATSIFCTGVWSLQGNESRSAMCRKKLKEGQEWWSYVCMADSPGLAQNSSGVANRVVMWRHWKEQTTGFLYWVVNSFGSMSPLKSRSGLPEGDGILVYPGETFGVKVPCVSIRLERWRDGSEDYELLKMYEAKLGRAETEKLLSNVYTNPTVYTKNISHVDAMKKVILEALR